VNAERLRSRERLQGMQYLGRELRWWTRELPPDSVSQRFVDALVSYHNFRSPQSPIGEMAPGRLAELTRAFLDEALHRLIPPSAGWLVTRDARLFRDCEYLGSLGGLYEADSKPSGSIADRYLVPEVFVGKVAPGSCSRRLCGPAGEVWTLHAMVFCVGDVSAEVGSRPVSEYHCLIRNRKGRLPHILAVTAEPLPTRIASLALGTGDLDCVYHFALYELEQAIKEVDNEDQMDMLQTLIQGRRLRDISDLPFDLAT